MNLTINHPPTNNHCLPHILSINYVAIENRQCSAITHRTSFNHCPIIHRRRKISFTRLLQKTAYATIIAAVMDTLALILYVISG